MNKEIIKEAASIEEAKALIVAELGVSEDAIAFEIVQEPEKKVLGLFGGTPAIVKGTVVGGTAAAAAEAYLRAVLAGLGVEDFSISVTEQDNGSAVSDRSGGQPRRQRLISCDSGHRQLPREA